MSAFAPPESVAEEPDADGFLAPGQPQGRSRLWLSLPDAGSVRARFDTLARRIRRLADRTPLTRLGWLLLGLSVLAWFAGWLLGWIELPTMAALGLLLLVLAVPFTVGRTSVTSQLEMSSLRVVVGEQAAGQLLVQNTSTRRQLPFELDLSVGESSARFAVPSLAAGESHEELLLIPTERRGVIQIGPATAVRGDPLGLLRRGVPAGEQQLLYVHPHTVRLGHLGYGLLRDLEGSESNALSNSDVAFHALREYEPGDDRRHIHWKSSARANQLMVRQFVDTRRSHITILLSADDREYAGDEEYETAVSVVGSIGLQALRDEQRLNVITAGDRLPTLSGQRFLDGLASVERRHKGGGLAANVLLMPEGSRQSSVLVLVTGSRLEPTRLRATAKRLSTSGLVLCVRIDASTESAFSVVGGLPTLSVADLKDLRRLLRAAS